MFKTSISVPMTALSIGLLSACGGPNTDPNAGSELLTNGQSVRSQIEQRHERFKGIGKNFKAISDELKSDNPDVQLMQTSAINIAEFSAGIEEWFPAGTGSNSGVDTDALAVIWTDRDDFDAKVIDYQTALAALNTAASSDDPDAIALAFQNTGGTCKACHEKYRQDD